MTPFHVLHRAVNLRKAICMMVLTPFIFTSLSFPVYAQKSSDQLPWMPKPGIRLDLSPSFTPAHLKGMVIHPDNALAFDFLIHQGDEPFLGNQKQEEYKKLIKYFLASLAIPDDNQWVNLSPYEKDRIIKDDFGKTEMGRDLLAQDYVLKQITASMIYPESQLGKSFWDKIYSQAYQQYGATNIPVNTFNKVWITPDEAYIYEQGNTVYIVKQKLKVMLEEDYLAMSHQKDMAESRGSLPSKAGLNVKAMPTGRQATQSQSTNALGSQIVKEIVLPALEKEVNEGKNFAMLRQVYSGMLLAAWYKRSLKESLLGKIYADQAKVKGVDQSDPKTNEAIYQQYLKAFKKGVFNYIKEDVDKYTNESIPRKYFSGGTEGYTTAVYGQHVKAADQMMVARDLAMTGEDLEAVGTQLSEPDQTMTAASAVIEMMAQIEELSNTFPPSNMMNRFVFANQSTLAGLNQAMKRFILARGIASKLWPSFEFKEDDLMWNGTKVGQKSKDGIGEFDLNSEIATASMQAYVKDLEKRSKGNTFNDQIKEYARGAVEVFRGEKDSRSLLKVLKQALVNKMEDTPMDMQLVGVISAYLGDLGVPIGMTLIEDNVMKIIDQDSDSLIESEVPLLAEEFANIVAQQYGIDVTMTANAMDRSMLTLNLPQPNQYGFNPISENPIVPGFSDQVGYKLSNGEIVNILAPNRPYFRDETGEEGERFQRGGWLAAGSIKDDELLHIATVQGEKIYIMKNEMGNREPMSLQIQRWTASVSASSYEYDTFATMNRLITAAVYVNAPYSNLSTEQLQRLRDQLKDLMERLYKDKLTLITAGNRLNHFSGLALAWELITNPSDEERILRLILAHAVFLNTEVGQQRMEGIQRIGHGILNNMNKQSGILNPNFFDTKLRQSALVDKMDRDLYDWARSFEPTTVDETFDRFNQVIKDVDGAMNATEAKQILDRIGVNYDQDNIRQGIAEGLMIDLFKQSAIWKPTSMIFNTRISRNDMVNGEDPAKATFNVEKFKEAVEQRKNSTGNTTADLRQQYGYRPDTSWNPNRRGQAVETGPDGKKRLVGRPDGFIPARDKMMEANRQVSPIKDFAMETAEQRKTRISVFSFLGIQSTILVGMLAANLVNSPTVAPTPAQLNPSASSTNDISTVELKDTKGGIDLNSINLNLQIRRDGQGVPLPVFQQDLERINIDGLIPVIINIKPATSLPIISELQSSSNLINS